MVLSPSYQNIWPKHLGYSMQIKIQGVHTALITPFTREGKLDEEGLISLIQRQIDAEVDGVIFLGSTAEEPTLNEEEEDKIIELGRRLVTRPILMGVGAGDFSTARTIENLHRAERIGADYALVIVPYYNRPTQEGLYQHFKAIAKSTRLPILIYNNPSRCGVNISVDTLIRLFEVPNIIGIKEASGNINQIIDIVAAARKHRPDYSIVSGDDGVTLPLMAVGGHGIVSVLSNLLPEEMKSLVTAIQEGDMAKSIELHHDLNPMFKAEFIETNPVPIKTAMALTGLPAGPVRLPLAPLQPANLAILQQALSSHTIKTPCTNTLSTCSN